MPLSHVLLQLLSGEPLTRDDRFQIALVIVRLARQVAGHSAGHVVAGRGANGDAVAPQTATRSPAT